MQPQAHMQRCDEAQPLVRMQRAGATAPALCRAPGVAAAARARTGWAAP